MAEHCITAKASPNCSVKNTYPAWSWRVSKFLLRSDIVKIFRKPA
jgi:hypothetical protein